MSELLDLVGRRFEPLETTVALRATMNYAAAVGDANSCYFDDSRPGGVVAPPLYAVALSWPLLSDLPRQLGGALAAQHAMSAVHYTEDLTLTRLLRPGDQARVQGRVAAVRPHPKGTRLLLALDVTDRDGEPVHTERVGVLVRGLPCIGSGRGDEVPAVPPDRVAEPAWEVELPIDPLAPWVYDGCTDIVFGIHTVPRMARALGLPGVVLQGTATLAMAVRELVVREAGGDPARVRRIACRFAGWVRPGTTIRLACSPPAATEGGRVVRFGVCDDAGRPVVRDGLLMVA